ncbi:Uncharacterised protein [Streptococcus pseudoporcinus]|uniref:Uncharacterized protein n=1 Tax=Streptococcus pseudoporcinus TaxID=361101 RepID=A0A4U9XTZ1_9STRE|nr:Uncharacterised protein [Streptococcus pseudoporcinus]
MSSLGYYSFYLLVANLDVRSLLESYVVMFISS